MNNFVFKNISLSILCAVILFSSCSDKTVDNNDANVNMAKRLYFANQEEFSDTYQSLFNLTKDELEVWAIEKGHEPLYMTDADSSYTYFSNSLRSILNKNGEYQVGDSIYRVDTDGAVYAYKKGQENSISKIDQIISLPLDEFNGSSLKTIIQPPGTIDARGQETFNLKSYRRNACNGPIVALVNGVERKFVHEIWVEEVNDMLYAYLRLKMEYKSGSWKPAGEPRSVNLNLKVYSLSGYLVKTISQNVSCVQYDYNCLLHSAGIGDYAYVEGRRIKFALEGKVFHQVLTDSYVWEHNVDGIWGLNVPPRWP